MLASHIQVFVRLLLKAQCKLCRIPRVSGLLKGIHSLVILMQQEMKRGRGEFRKNGLQKAADCIGCPSHSPILCGHARSASLQTNQDLKMKVRFRSALHFPYPLTWTNIGQPSRRSLSTQVSRQIGCSLRLINSCD